MLILTAHNVTNDKGVRKNGTADYDVSVAINETPIWQGHIKNHIRDDGAEALLRMIADKMENARSGHR